MTPHLAWWRRPVGLKALLWVSLGLGLTWALGMALAIWAFYRHWQVQVQVKDQPIALSLPKGVTALARVNEPVALPLHLRPRLPLHLDQEVAARIDQAFTARLRLETTLPVHAEVRVSQTVPVQTTLHLKVAVRSWLPEVALDLPVRLNLPIEWALPVNVQVPVKFDTLVSGQLRQDLRVPLQADWVLRPQVDTTVRARLLGETAFTLEDGLSAMPMRIHHAELSLPFDLGLMTAKRAPAVEGR